ncbi:MAG: AMP-binding protein, partial [Halobacteria archaeon]|nr:AMP-binding protein [Halobacteria archaeon]
MEGDQMETLEEINEVVHEPSEEFVESTNIYAFMQKYGIDDYDELIERTTSDIEWFWDTVVDELNIEFYEDYDEVRDNTKGPQFTRWYPGGEINIAHNVVDRHAEVDSPNRNRVACIWEGEPGDIREVTFHELHRQSNKVANALEERGVGKGDTVGLYMPMVPEVISILYGIFKVGAVAVPIF